MYGLINLQIWLQRYHGRLSKIHFCYSIVDGIGNWTPNIPRTIFPLACIAHIPCRGGSQHALVCQPCNCIPQHVRSFMETEQVSFVMVCSRLSLFRFLSLETLGLYIGYSQQGTLKFIAFFNFVWVMNFPKVAILLESDAMQILRHVFFSFL